MFFITINDLNNSVVALNFLPQFNVENFKMLTKFISYTRNNSWFQIKRADSDPHS
jgi:hypothetical protein